MLAILGALLAEHDEAIDESRIEHPDVEVERVSVLSGVRFFATYFCFLTNAKIVYRTYPYGSRRTSCRQVGCAAIQMSPSL
jgi:hypothetical protein